MSRHHASASAPPEEFFESDLFADRPGSVFAVLVVCRGRNVVPGREIIRSRSAALREDVFAGGRMLAGPEPDHDDDRSLHVAVVENAGAGRARVTGGLRLIFRRFVDGATAVDDALPIEAEGHFGDLFTAPLGDGSVEVSRLCIVAERGGARVRMLSSLIGFAAGVVSDAGAVEAYAMLGDELLRPLRRFVPLEQLADARDLEYPTPKIPVRIPSTVLRTIRLTAEDQVMYAPLRGAAA